MKSTTYASALLYTFTLCLQQGSASEATLMALLAARCKAVRRVQASNGDSSEAEIFAKLVAYTSEQVSTEIFFQSYLHSD